MTRHATLTLYTLLVAVLSGCSGETRQPRLPVPIDQLAHEVHLRIGGTRLRLPLISLIVATGHSQVHAAGGGAPGIAAMPVADLVAHDGGFANPIPDIAYVNVALSSFNALKDTRADASVATTGLCPLLRQRWASELCRNGLIDGVHAFEPGGFTLIDEAALRRHRPQLGMYGGAYLSVGDAIVQLAPYTTAPKAHCDVDSHGVANTSCTIAMRVDGELLAVWSTGRTQVDHAALHRAAAAIRLLIEHGAGEHEQFDALTSGLRHVLR